MHPESVPDGMEGALVRKEISLGLQPQGTEQFLLRGAQCWAEMKEKGRLQKEVDCFSSRLLLVRRVEGQRVGMLAGSHSSKCAHLLAR